MWRIQRSNRNGADGRAFGEVECTDAFTPTGDPMPASTAGSAGAASTEVVPVPDSLTTLHRTITEAGQQITRDNLHWGPSLGAATGPISFGFRTSAPGYSVSGEDVIGTFTPLSAAEQTAARAALQFWSELTNITFVDYGNSNSATIEFSNYRSSTDNSEAFAFYPGSTSASSYAGDVFVNTFYASTTNDSPGTYEWLTFIHETGHALGLEHPGNYNAGPGQAITYSNNAAYVEDTRQYSVMSYFGETYTGASYSVFNETPMLTDIAAIQRLYGTNTLTRRDDTFYGFHSNLPGSVFSITASTQRVVFTVYDGGGTDTLDFSGYSNTQTIDLNAEHFSSVGGNIYNVAVAQNVLIENAYGGSGTDTIIGNNGNNVLRAGGGNDVLSGGSGTNTLDGGSGTDTVDYSVNPGIATGHGVYVNLPKGTGTDGVGTLDALIAIENVIGTSLNDVVIGDGANNVLQTGAGNDVLSGGAGTNTLNGGSGTDTVDYSANPGIATGHGVYVNLAAGLGTDAVGTTDALISIEDVIGTPLNDIIIGDDSNNLLVGGSGTNTFDGGGGTDTVDYSANPGIASGHGVYINLAAGTGTDGVGTFDTLSAIENVTGTSLSDFLVASAAINMITGGSSNDIFAFNSDQANSDTITDFNGNGGAELDQLEFHGYGTAAAGATLTQIDATHWSINSSNGAIHDILTLTNGASVHASDFVFV